MKRKLESFIQILNDELKNDLAYENKIRKSRQRSKILKITLNEREDEYRTKKYLTIEYKLKGHIIEFIVDIIEIDYKTNTLNSVECHLDDYKSKFRFNPHTGKFPHAVMIFIYWNNRTSIQAISISDLFSDNKRIDKVRNYYHRYLALTSLNSLLSLDYFDVDYNTIYFRWNKYYHRQLYSKLFNMNVTKDIENIFVNSNNYSELLICKNELIDRGELLDMIDFLTPDQKEKYLTKNSYEIVNVYKHSLELPVQRYLSSPLFEIYPNCDGTDIEKTINHHLYFVVRDMLWSDIDIYRSTLLWREINRILYDIRVDRNFNCNHIHLAYLTKTEFKSFNRIRCLIVYLNEIFKTSKIA